MIFKCFEVNNEDDITSIEADMPQEAATRFAEFLIASIGEQFEYSFEIIVEDEVGNFSAWDCRAVATLTFYTEELEIAPDVDN